MDGTVHAEADASPGGAALREAWTRLRRGRPSIDMREAALGLGVTEVELVASVCGDGAMRLLADWAALVASLPELGVVVASTRNARASIQHRGTHPGVPGRVTVVPIDPIDVHVAPRAVRAIFALREGDRSSIRLFDAAGTRVHEIAVGREGRTTAFDALVAVHASTDQSSRESVVRTEVVATSAAGAAGVVRARWEALGGPDDVAALCAALDLTRHEGLRAAPPEWVWPVSRHCVRQVLGWVAAEAIPVTVTVGNGVVRQSRTGYLGRAEDRGRSLAIRMRDFGLQLRIDRVASAWVVSMPGGGRTRVATALELLDEKGAPMARIAGADDRRDLDAEHWSAALGRIPAAPREPDPRLRLGSEPDASL